MRKTKENNAAPAAEKTFIQKMGEACSPKEIATTAAIAAGMYVLENAMRIVTGLDKK